MFPFLAIIVQIGHDIRYRHTNYWTRAEQFFTYFYLNTKTWDHYLQILRYLHFTDNAKEIDKNDDNYDRLWKIRECSIIEILQPFQTFGDWQGDCTSQTEGCIQSVYLKETHVCKSKFTSSVTLMATHDMVVFFGKDSKWATKDITVSHATVKQLTLRVNGHGHKL